MLPVRKIIATTLRDARLTRGYSQDYMAMKMSISQNAYSKMELGETPVTIDRFLYITNILEYDEAKLLDKMAYQFTPV